MIYYKTIPLNFVRERTFFKPMSRSVTSIFWEPQPPSPPRRHAAKIYAGGILDEFWLDKSKRISQ